MHAPSRHPWLAAGIALALAAAAGPTAADTAAQNLAEARQESQIWTTYALSPHLRASDLKVAVRAGKATLTGTVDEGASKELAAQIALGVSGITDVDNQIVVQPDYAPPPRNGDRAFGEVVDDASITAAVKSRLLWSRETEGLASDVDTRRGKVTLTGTADTKAARELAGRLALDTRGVVGVDNQLVVGGKGTTNPRGRAAEETARESRAEVADSWITTKVKSTFMYSSNVDGAHIAVSTNKGVVTLKGHVGSDAERALAIELARNVRGVRSVLAKGLTVHDVVAGR